MKIKFKKQFFQTEAVNAVADCFAGQPKVEGITYRIDPGRASGKLDQEQQRLGLLESGFKNRELVLTREQLLENIQAVQRRQNLPQSTALVSNKVCPVNLDVEMETGTGKTYCYIKTMFQLNRRYGWSKFIVMVPSIAIREGVFKSFEITAEHFLEEYGKRTRFFIYNSKQLHHLEQFSSDGGINVMIINVQAFAAKGKDNLRIYAELDDFQSRRPIDVIKSNHPVLILDEPQKMEGPATTKALEEFNPLAVLRYSATHKTEHNKIYRLDALDAYNQKLVKKIAVRGISVRGLTGTNAYLYLESIQISANNPPVARIEYEVKQKSGIKRIIRKFGKGDNLQALSGGLSQYQGFVIADINAVTDTVTFTNGIILEAGEATGDVSETTLRRIQIREAVKTHLGKEQELFHKGIKVLSLFFIDEVAKYRRYDGGVEQSGEYAQILEEEYIYAINELPLVMDQPYRAYIDGIKAEKTHDGYFSIDKKTRRLVDPEVKSRNTETEDVDAYDLILKNKERLLSLEEPVRFIFSHSALSEGWDNPNVFVICTLKHSESSIRKRQEVGRGLRLCVNQAGERIDSGANIHDINLLTVIASESYKDFTAGLQKEISESLSARPRKANEAYFTGKIIKTEDGATLTITPQMARQIYRYLLKNDYTDDNDGIASAYHEAKKSNMLVPLPPELAPYTGQVMQLIESVFSDAALPLPDNDRQSKPNLLNQNIEKAEFKALWERINQKAAYSVYFDSAELIRKCLAALGKLEVTKLQYTVTAGEQADSVSYEEIKSGEGFKVTNNSTEEEKISVHSAVKYDLIGRLAEDTQLTRRTITEILQNMNNIVFIQYRHNPEDFIMKAGSNH